jgi:hypothetical protein
MENKDLQKKAWDLLKSKGLKPNEIMMIRNGFADTFKNEYPYINIVYKKGKINYYHSTIEDISNLAFNSKKEVILVNAIYENIDKDNFNINEFIQNIKFSFRIIGSKSKWS